MESTGNYWQNLYVELQRNAMEVTLCNGKFTKHAKGKKTDVKDCRWIQKLHALGLLTSSFLPDQTTEELRTFCRQRNNMIDLAAQASHKMQKYLRLLNFRLDVVVNDIVVLQGLLLLPIFAKETLTQSALLNTAMETAKNRKRKLQKH